MPKLHIFVGSRSDLKHLKESKMTEVFDSLKVTFAVHVCSAHRNADELAKFVAEVCDEDAKVLIGIAGMAAALPGALAASSNRLKLVLGVPLDEDGIDSCLYMPPGVPVATMGVGKAGLVNAAIAACQVLALSRPALEGTFANWLARNTKPPEFNIDLSEVRPDPKS